VSYSAALTIHDALTHHQAGRLGAAVQIYRQILIADPNHADCLHLLGMIAFQSGQPDQAEELIRRAIAIHPAAASYHSNLGNVLQSQGAIDEAATCYLRALAINPNQSAVHLNLGHVHKALGNLDCSIASYRRALALKPDLLEARVSQSTALLLQGDFTKGWRDFDLRWQTRSYDTPLRAYPQPQWTGKHLNSGRLLIWGEQGIGDEIMFAGLIPELVAQGMHCVIDCDPRLQPLFARSFPSVEVISGDEASHNPNLNVVAHIPSGSLPALLRNRPQAFDATSSPYLVPDPAKLSHFRTQYKSDPLIVSPPSPSTHKGERSTANVLLGLAWHTRNLQSGPGRSIPLASFELLLSQPGVRCVSLQYGDRAWLEEQAASAAFDLLIDHDVDQLYDVNTFAAQVAAMDLVVTIDNSTAHIAAALGVPTWLLLPCAPDWRWLLHRTDSPWYPSMRLFRQPQRGDWPSVLSQVQSALAQKLTRT
jgi:tetratricopeptide (TPR) repeat protein